MESRSDAVAKTKAAKKIERLKQRAREAEAANELLEKRVRKLKKKVDTQKQQISDLRERLQHTPQTIEAPTSSIPELGDRGDASIAASHRTAWRRHSYLRDRYEFHLNAGSTNERARGLANEDLKQEYGSDCGYTDDELSAILS